MSEHLNHLTLADQFFKGQAAAGASGELSTILNRVTLAGRMIANTVLRAGLQGNLGKTGSVNVQGEEVKALDRISDDIFQEVFDRTPVVAGIASEENEEAFFYPEDQQTGKYVLLHDPLDGSGNIDVNGSMGTIFSVFRRKALDHPATLDDFLRTGSEQVAAGYLLYGPATLFVYSTGQSLQGFTLDRSVGAFFHTHEDVQIPNGRGAYSVNEANEAKWTEQTQAMVRAFREGKAPCGKRSARYVGALVADFHRTLVQGGVYMYPGEVEKPKGKLRLLYEAFPLAFLARAAGGRATDGKVDILGKTAAELHERTPLIIGSKGDVDAVMQLLGEE